MATVTQNQNVKNIPISDFRTVCSPLKESELHLLQESPLKIIDVFYLALPVENKNWNFFSRNVACNLAQLSEARAASIYQLLLSKNKPLAQMVANKLQTIVPAKFYGNIIRKSAEISAKLNPATVYSDLVKQPKKLFADGSNGNLQHKKTFHSQQESFPNIVDQLSRQ